MQLRPHLGAEIGHLSRHRAIAPNQDGGNSRNWRRDERNQDSIGEQVTHHQQQQPPQSTATNDKPAGTSRHRLHRSTAVSGGSKRDIRIGTYNIRSGNHVKLPMAIRAMDLAQVDVCVLTETRLSGYHTLKYRGYQVVATNIGAARTGGVALIFREAKHWHIEGYRTHGPNVLSAYLRSGDKAWLLIGAYFPPSADAHQMAAAIDVATQRSNGPTIICGDFNMRIGSVSTARDVALSTSLMATGCTESLADKFRIRRRFWKRTTWIDPAGQADHQCDYILVKPSDVKNWTGLDYKTPRGYTSDHILIVGRLRGENKTSHQEYYNKRSKFPFVESASELQERYNTLLLQQEQKPADRQTRRPWISTKTWNIVDGKQELYRNKNACTNFSSKVKTIHRSLRRSISQDRKTRIIVAGNEIANALESREYKKSWMLLRGWYKNMGLKPSKPTSTNMRTTVQKYQKLYQQKQLDVPCPDLTCLRNYDVEDGDITMAEMDTAAKGLRIGKAPGPSGLRTDTIASWRADYHGRFIAPFERTRRTPSREAQAALEIAKSQHPWTTTLDMLNTILRQGELPSTMLWSTIVQIPKAGSTELRGIGLVDALWKLLGSIIAQRITARVQFHHAIHGFRTSRGTSSAILEAKLQLAMARSHNRALSHIYLDLSKAYDTVSRPRLMRVMQAHGIGPNICTVIQTYWQQSQLAIKQGGFHSTTFTAERGITQGDILSPLLFNLVINAVLQVLDTELDTSQWGRLTTNVNTAMSNTAQNSTSSLISIPLIILFYADDVFFGGTSPEALQFALDKMTNIFRGFGLELNTSKSKAMHIRMPTPHALMSKKAYNRRVTMDHATPSAAELGRTNTTCTYCGLTMQRRSMNHHLLYSHRSRTQPATERETIMEYLEPNMIPLPISSSTWTVTKDTRTCPVTDCPYIVPDSRTAHSALCTHFANRHHLDLLEATDYTIVQCDMCKLYLMDRISEQHRNSTTCKERTSRVASRKIEEANQLRETRTFNTANGNLERVHSFRYLGRILNSEDKDWEAVAYNLSKARKQWARSRTMLRCARVPLRTRTHFYLAIVTTTLLHGSETCILNGSILIRLRAFHHNVALQLLNRKGRQDQHGTWMVVSSRETLDATGLKDISFYITERRETARLSAESRADSLLPYVKDTGSGTRNNWWEQERGAEPRDHEGKRIRARTTRSAECRIRI